MHQEYPSLRLAVLISGTGRSLQNLIQCIDRGELNAEICTVISSSAKAAGLDFADANEISSHVISRQGFETPEDHSEAIFSICRKAKIDLVVMGGFLQHLLIPKDFEMRVINIHPSLIPEFCGPGFYGTRVHEAVLAADVAETGCTVHFVDNEYDHGPIILQRIVEVLPKDNVTLLAQRVFAEECEALPEAIRLIAQGRIDFQDGIVVVRGTPATCHGERGTSVP